MSDFDVVVVGAGYGGMGAAALLAESGLRVLVLEQSESVGGRAWSFTDDEGFTWEYGAHSMRLAEKGIAAELFRRLGDEIVFVPHAKDAGLIYRDRLWDRPEGVIGYLFTPMLPLRSRLALLVLLARIKRTRPEDWYDRTLSDFSRSTGLHSLVEEVLPLLGMAVMCPDPAKVSAGEVIAFVRRMLLAGVSVGEPVGGTAQVFRKLSRHVESSGRIHTGERATELMVDNGRVAGVRTTRDTYRADTVIFAARLPLLFEIAQPSWFPPELVHYARSIEHSSSLVIDFVTDRPICERKGGILGVDIPVWARFQTNADPSFTPRGLHLSTWGIMLPFGFRGEPEAVDAAERRLRDLVGSLFPLVRDALTRERRLVVEVMNGTVLTPSSSLPHRPPVACPSPKGLYLAGDTVAGEGCSGDISFSSAMKACDAILEERRRKT
ncbi:MAG TPA: FAD-dependent oxidoreductase [Deltaproteobacteria bacterium]|nr:FAD-dependent oxidoreductase [Deltaproteobacteria bacterium]HOM28401.1 FAD-dependent oxidoreductase [Deltaproteobacteria bacterium]HPP81583.1 FAD-dependent oxidoreductase [Deltaproteobacteria bacterium]